MTSLGTIGRLSRAIGIGLLVACSAAAWADEGPHPTFDERMVLLTADIDAGKFKQIHSLLVYQGGEVAFERYFKGNDDWIDFKGGIKRIRGEGDVQWHANRQHYMASVTKTVTALLTGIALEELKLSVDARLEPLLPPELKPLLQQDAGYLTLKHLLTMQTGFQWDEWTGDDLREVWKTDDFGKFLLKRTNLGPEAPWVYNSAVPNLLLRTLEHQLAQPLGTWANERFFGPLGITNYTWHRQPTGTPEGSARLHLTPNDMLKIGAMMMSGGKYEGEQVVPPAWLDAMTRKHCGSDAGDYGYLTWLRELDGRPYISADGDGGQYINIFPHEEVIVVMTQGNYLEWPLYANQATMIMRDYIFNKP
ncbi:serine hydrolase domain-containing protein [Kordiimonas sp.]|uniref:serine hydrolase domain-containing protein n=1 Tax=Kordiimonas sp. TaxID=1970157 RepID=UPI003B52D2AC